MIDGDAEILCDSGKYFVTRSDLYIFPPSFQHFRVAKEDDVLKCQQVPIRFTYERLNHGEDVYALFDGVFHTKSDILIFRHSTGLRMIFEELLSETRPVSYTHLARQKNAREHSAADPAGLSGIG